MKASDLPLKRIFAEPFKVLAVGVDASLKAMAKYWMDKLKERQDISPEEEMYLPGILMVLAFMLITVFWIGFVLLLALVSRTAGHLFNFLSHLIS